MSYALNKNIVKKFSYFQLWHFMKSLTESIQG